MNELFFSLHVSLVLCITFFAFRRGKEALMLWICLQALLANFFVLKQVMLFGFCVTCSDVFAVGGLLGLNLLREFYGDFFVKKTIRFCFYAMLVFALFAKIHLAYVPASVDFANSSYDILLSHSPRLLLASLIVFFMVQKIDMYVFALLKARKNSSSFAFRNLLSLLSSQLLDTVLFTFLGLYGIMSSLWDIVGVSFLIKSLAVFGLTPAVWIAQKMSLLQKERL